MFGGTGRPGGRRRARKARRPSPGPSAPGWASFAKGRGAEGPAPLGETAAAPRALGFPPAKETQDAFPTKVALERDK